MSSHDQSPYAQQQPDQDRQLRDTNLGTASVPHPHGLEALSAAALYHPPEANMTPQSMPPDNRNYDTPFDPSPSYNEQGVSSGSPSATITSTSF